MDVILLAIGGCQWLLIGIILLDIGGYYINGYWWIFFITYWWLLMVIILVVIVGYYINGYW